MEENSQFNQQLQAALAQKQNWFNSVALPDCLNQYRLLSSCVHNLYEMLKKKALISPDPYAVEKHISDIVVPETSPFSDNDIANVLGERLSDYDAILDFIGNYFRFTVDNMPAPKIKKMIELNNFLDWSNLSQNSTQSNTHALATLLSQARINAPAILISMINDCSAKGQETTRAIAKCLSELAVFQKELYKGEIRKGIFEHPDFNSQKAAESPDAEMAEIKRLYPKVMGKKAFYTDLINEIIAENHNQDKVVLREKVLQKLQIKEAPVKQEIKKKGPNPKNILIETVMAIGGAASTIEQIRIKLVENFNIFYANKTSIFKKIGAAFKKAFKLKSKPKTCIVKISDVKTGTMREQEVEIETLLADLAQKSKVYAGIASQGMEYEKLISYPDEKIYNFVCKQISECQSIFTTVNALDSFFKTQVDIINRPKIKGLQIDLSAFRNIIITSNKKRGEYQAVKEESEQLNKLGIK